MNPQAFILPVDGGDFSPALTFSNDFPHPKERNGVPVSYYHKQLLKPGLRLKDKAGKVQEITPDRIKALALNFARAKSNGFEPSLPLGSHNVEQAKNAGWLVDVSVKPDGSLWGLHQFIGSGDEVARIVASNKSSINTLLNYDDGQGNVYPELIDHNAILPHPRINLADFVPAIAASRGQAIDVVELSLAAPTTEVQMDLSKLRTRLGAAADVPDEKVIELAEQQLGTLKPEADKAVSLARDLEAANLKLSRTTTPEKPSAAQLFYLGKALELSRDQAVRAAGAHVVTEAQKRFLKTETFDTGGLTLAREVEDGDVQKVAGMEQCIAFYDLLQHAQPPIKPRPSSITAARQTTENANDLNKQDDKAAEEAGLKQGEAYKNEQLKARGLEPAKA